MELVEARMDMHVELETGKDTRCPCCNSYLKVYKRSIYSKPARELISLYRKGGADKYVHMSEFMGKGTGGGDLAKARFFGLIHQAANTNRHKKTNGYWILTQKGVDFVRGEAVIDKYALVYQNNVLGFAGQKVDIKECLGKEFSYHELMWG